MTRTFAIALAALVATTGASLAQSVNPAELNTIRSYAGNVDVSDISPAEANLLIARIHSGDSEGQKRAFVKNFFQ